MPSDKKKSQQSSQRKSNGKGLRAQFRAEDNKQRRAKKEAKKVQRKILHFKVRLEQGKSVPTGPLGQQARNAFVLGS